METLPEEVVVYEILAKCAEYGPALRVVCRAWATARLPARQSLGEGLSFLARRGHLKLLEWARTQSPYSAHPFDRYQLRAMMAAAAANGHTALAELVFAWGGEGFGALEHAALRGDVDALTKALSWVGWHLETMNEAFIKAASGGHIPILEALEDWCLSAEGMFDYTHLSHAAEAAAKAGHDDVVVWLWERGLKNPDAVLYGAAMGGQAYLCYWVRDWGATDYNPMLLGAALGGHKALCLQAVEWGANDFNGMLIKAAAGGHESLCRLAVAHGATVFERMLIEAAASGHGAVCCLARTLGATLFDEALLNAAACGQCEMLCLMKTWLEESPPGSRATLDKALVETFARRQRKAAIVLYGWGARPPRVAIREQTTLQSELVGAVREGLLDWMELLFEWGGVRPR